MIRKIPTLLFFTFYFSFFALPDTQAQDSSHIQISLLTCSPGEELYSTFGHTALRVVDSSSMSDWVFNFGTFNFDDPNFYTKFIRGKLLYFLSTEKFHDFVEDYRSDSRGVTEQVLNLPAKEKISILHALYENIKEENKFYKYDFFYDNCTTRIRDIILHHRKQNTDIVAVVPGNFSFRNAIHEYLDKNRKDWSKLGIDILLGSPTDKKMTVIESQFLPENLMNTLARNNNTQNLIVRSKSLCPIPSSKNKIVLFTPLNVFIFIFLLIILLNFSKSVVIKNLSTGIDGMIFFLAGILGITLIFMWTSTDHAMCKYNYNVLWALPTHCIAAFFINSKKHWIKLYFGATAISAIILLASWAFLPQQLNTALIPMVLLIIYRSADKFLKK